MMSEYVLKEEVPYNVLIALNGKRLETLTSSEKMFKAIKFLYMYPQEDQFEDWIAAIKSGKKIVNPMSPREELKKYYESFDDQFMINRAVVKDAMKKTVEIIAKEHPDVATWLKEDSDHDE